VTVTMPLSRTTKLTPCGALLTISRELRRNAATRSGRLDHRALVAQCLPASSSAMSGRPRAPTHGTVPRRLTHRIGTLDLH